MLIARVASLSMLAFFIIGSYGIARPSIDSLYLKHYPSTSLPIVWIATALFMAVALFIYNHFNQRHSLLKIFGIACVISGALLVGCLVAYNQGYAESLFFLYIWKEIYVVVLIEIFWSFADVVFSVQRARLIYGILLAMGSLGGLVGNYTVGHLAHAMGTVNVIGWVVPLLLVCWLISVIFAKSAGDSVPKSLKSKSHWFESLHVVKTSRYLVPLLFLISIIQIATTLIDYEFNAVIQQNYLDDDARTAILGQTHAVIDFLAITLQLITAPILMFFGVGKTLLSIPILVGTAVLAFVAWPQLITMIITKIASKCFDYSVFRAAKEILYIPLSHPEKTQGKALIDILVYRIAKGVSSLMILALIYFGLSSWTMHVTVAFLLMWFVLTYIIVKRYQNIEVPCDRVKESSNP
jgi:AAA family ATP:ADP antiporter